MATSDQMAGYSAHLSANTPSSSKGKPVTEIAIFKLQPPFDADQTSALAVFEADIVQNTRPGAPYATGIRKMAWGFAVDDPKIFVWMLYWDKIEDHWTFWLTPGFLPVMGAISKLFVPGRPLVRHYDFGAQGMLDNDVEFVRLIVWDDGEAGRENKNASKLSSEHSGVTSYRGAYAVDLDEDTWWATLLGYGNEEEALAATVKPVAGAVSHVYKLQYT